MFSITTMASSTTKPVAMVRAISVRLLIEKSTLERLAAQNIPVLRTDQSGDVTLFVENGRLQVRPYRLRSLPGGIE